MFVRRIGLLLSALLLLSTFPVSAATPTADGSAVVGNVATGTSSGTVTLSTSLTNDIIYISTFARSQGSSSPNITSITSSHVTWARRAQKQDHFTSGSADCAGCWADTELWWGAASATLSSEVITITYAATFDVDSKADVVVQAFNGTTSIVTPFDPNGVLPVTAGLVAQVPSITLSTSNTNDMMVGVLGGIIAAANCAATGWTATGRNTGPHVQSVCFVYKTAATPQTGLTITFLTGSVTNWEAIADAITGGAPPSTGGLVQGWP
jgi:hypothetical protein